MSYRILIVDDEEPARRKIAQFLQQMPQDFILAFAKNGAEAQVLLQNQPFDLLFLDIQMPQMNAFDLLRTVGLEDCPPIIFSTAYDQYALKAFEVHAVDYLLKPYDLGRFEIAVNKVLQLIHQNRYTNRDMLELLKNWKPEPQKLNVLWVNHGAKLIPVEVAAIAYLESDGNYVRIHCREHKYLIRQGLNELYQKLSEHQFVRVHRSYVVNQSYIKEIHPKSHGDMYAILKSGQVIPVSRRYRDQLLNS